MAPPCRFCGGATRWARWAHEIQAACLDYNCPGASGSVENRPIHATRIHHEAFLEGSRLWHVRMALEAIGGHGGPAAKALELLTGHMPPQEG